MDAAVRERALDPVASFIVQAPAGSGKTELLTRRVLALLATVEEPESVLAITFTRKAASEMRQRVVESLQAAANGEAPASSYEAEGRVLAAAVLQRDAERGWRLLDQPQRLNLRTIDGLCTQLAYRLPVVSTLGAPAAVIDDARPLYREAAAQLLADPDEQLDRVLLQLGNRLDDAETLLADLLARRDQWARHAVHGAHSEDRRHELEQQLAVLVGARLATLRQQIPAPLADALAVLLAQSQRTRMALALAPAALPDVALPGTRMSDVSRWRALADLLLTQKGEVRKSVTRTQGFPTAKGDADLLGVSVSELKERKKALEPVLDTLRESPELVQALADCHQLPAGGYSDDDWALLDQLLGVLPALQVYLLDVFQRHGAIDFVEMAQRALLALGSDEHPTDLALALDLRLQHVLGR